VWISANEQALLGVDESLSPSKCVLNPKIKGFGISS
jgi:hypothetical protein